MVWTAETSCGNETGKIRYDVMRYLTGTGVDLGCGGLKVARHALGVDVANVPGVDIVCDVTKLRILASDSFDFVYSSHALEDQEDTLATLHEWWRLLRDDGRLILYLPHKDLYPNVGQPGANPAHKHDFLPDDIMRVMEEVGDWDLIVNETRDKRDEYSFLQVYVRKPRGHGHAHSWRKPAPKKRAGIVRIGALGDSLWASTVAFHYKAMGYHVTVYTEAQGRALLEHDPHIDDFIEWAPYMMAPTEMVPYFGHESLKYEKWVNLTQSVEVDLLPSRRDLRFYLSDTARHRLMNRNYFENIHAWADLPYQPPPRRDKETQAAYAQRVYQWQRDTFKVNFYPTPEEWAWAREQRKKYDGPVVLINPVGSAGPKTYMLTTDLLRELAARKMHGIVVGDLEGRGLKIDPPKDYGHVIGMGWPLRCVLTFAKVVDCVIGQESVVINSVANERVPKIVMLSHSSSENLTKHWLNCAAIESPDVPCFPCHRIHEDWTWCSVDDKTKGAACQAIPAADIATLMDEALAIFSGNKPTRDRLSVGPGA